MSFTDIIKLRRSRYELTDRLPISEEKLTEIIGQCILHTPSAFNSQLARVVLLLGEKHKQLWKLTEECLREIVPADKFAPTEKKLASFSAAFGTLLYYNDMDTVRQMQEQFPTYKDNFPVWAQQANGMLQFAVWTALAEAGVGASLQHYNPLIDARAARAFEVPASWQLVAQMPFGLPQGAAADKTFIPLERRFRIEK